MFINFWNEKALKLVSLTLSFVLIILSFFVFEIMEIKPTPAIFIPFVLIIGGSFLQDKRNKKNLQYIGWGLFYGSFLFFILIIILLILLSQVY